MRAKAEMSQFVGSPGCVISTPLHALPGQGFIAALADSRQLAFCCDLSACAILIAAAAGTSTPCCSSNGTVGQGLANQFMCNSLPPLLTDRFFPGCGGSLLYTMSAMT